MQARRQPGNQTTRKQQQLERWGGGGGLGGERRSKRRPGPSSQANSRDSKDQHRGTGSAHHTTNTAGGKAAHSTAGSVPHCPCDPRPATTRLWELESNEPPRTSVGTVRPPAKHAFDLLLLKQIVLGLRQMRSQFRKVSRAVLEFAQSISNEYNDLQKIEAQNCQQVLSSEYFLNAASKLHPQCRL
ncbi:hypothetical protein NDU88_006534 [Pleurodeles waltl]|uniref:Uncharacterized protein n=1 Tax=Pleurodeles waltl TaxID=8319 RepID=A0AAV7WAV9_PLEWA|nr:hypothetical protein NDU88_006534 [Pleurodeles waltl]